MVHAQQHEKAIPPPTRRGLSRFEAAEYVGVSATLFDRLVEDGRMPKPRRIDGRRVWDRRSVDVAFDALPGEENPDSNPFDT